MRYDARNYVCSVHCQIGPITMYFAFNPLGNNLYLFLAVHAEGSGSAYIDMTFTLAQVFTQWK